jgi:hypothetical protein
LYELASNLNRPSNQQLTEANRLLGNDPGFGSFSSGLNVNTRFARQMLETTGGYKAMQLRWFEALSTSVNGADVIFGFNNLYLKGNGVFFPAPWRDSAPIDNIDAFKCSECPEGGM